NLSIPPSESIARIRTVSPPLLYDHFIDGLIQGARECYRELPGNPIANVWVFDQKAAPPNFVITYRVLSHLEFCSELIPINELRRHLSYSSAHRHDLDALLRKLVEWRLINLSDSEFHVNHQSMINISSTGRYYLHELIRYPEYLYKLV